MHFSIPKSSLVLEPGKEGYISYDLYVNGLYHCSCRYRKLLTLHEKLKQVFGHGMIAGISFPPKRFLPLSDQQLESRRCQLEKYLQLVSQIQRVRNSEQFCAFMVETQLETYEKDEENGDDKAPGNAYSLEVETMMNSKTCLTLERKERGLSTKDILHRVCEDLKLPQTLHKFFGLVVLRKYPDIGTFSVVRRLEDYEAPWITMQRMDDNLKIILRKRFWDPDLDAELLRDPVGLNLRYCEAVADVEHDWCPVPPNVLAHLTQMQARGSKRQYLDLVRSQKYFGYWRFSDTPCLSDYPQPNTRVIVRVGDKELVTETLDKNSTSVFRVTRMRCWRISGKLPMTASNGNNGDEDESIAADLSFEYLVGKDQMDWVTIKSPQAVLISLCLQSIVDELLGKQLQRKGSVEPVLEPESRFSRRWFENRFSSSRSRDEPVVLRNAFVQNAVFHNIGDEDL
ncbi:unnamed protein product [Notodromas monacha]|uniref:PX domain-containing protein n=1 Tax=Notodromas monacha TaxID=399045 RepID=A0A7R9BQ70_9CRUS|nr:unnamed protein product [Notodromas monacha]CAG0918766.1 unnamed protein product [Notodromas monacha]